MTIPRYIKILEEVKPLEKPVREMRRTQTFKKVKQRILRQDPKYREMMKKLIKNWKIRNRERVNEYARRYSQNPEYKLKKAEYMQRPDIKAKTKAWQLDYRRKQYANPEIRKKILAQNRIYQLTPEYKERHRQATKRYYQRHRDDFRLKYILKKSKHI